MDSQTTAALAHLNALLPLAARQAQLPPEWRALHQTILRAFAARGRPPARAELAAGTPDVDAALARLRADDLVVLDEAGEIAGAYPFTLDATPHTVHVNGHTPRAMCAVDALAVGALFGLATAITSHCAATGAPVRVTQYGLTLPAAPADLRVGIHWQTPGGCAAHSLCREMPFLRDAAAAEAWRQQAPAERETFTAAQALALADAFFAPLMRSELSGVAER